MAMIKIIFFVFAIFIAGSIIYADEAKLGKDDFVSSAISDVFDKVGKVTSGEEPIIKDDYMAVGKNTEYAEPVGRRIEDPAIKPLKRPSASK